MNLVFHQSTKRFGGELAPSEAQPRPSLWPVDETARSYMSRIPTKQRFAMLTFGFGLW